MKRITSILTALLMFFTLPAFAQLEELNNKSVNVGGALQETFEPNTWYVLYNIGRPSYPYSVGVGEGNKLHNSLDIPGTMANDIAGYLLRFVPRASLDPNGKEGEFFIQTGLGDYWGVLTQGGNTGTTVEPEYYFNWGIIEGTTDCFWFQGRDLNGGNIKTLNNNTPPSTVAGWNDNIPTNAAGNDSWHIYSVEFEEVDPLFGAISTMLSTYMAHEDHYLRLSDPDNELVGTKPGQYSEEALATFKAALDAAAAAYEVDGEGYTVEQIEALNQAIIDTYQAVLDSRIPAELIPDGYYFIKSALTYYKEVEIDGESKDIHPQKAMVDYNGYAAWLTISTDTAEYNSLADCRYLWKVTHNNESGNYQLVNMAYDRYIKTVSQSANVVMSNEGDIADNEVTFNVINIDPKLGALYSIRRASDTGDYQYVHQGGHSQGAGENGYCVGWSFGGGYDASSWYIEQVDEALAQKLIDDFAPLRDRNLMVAEINEMLAVATPALKRAKDEVTNLDLEHPVITDASQFISPHTEATEGSVEALFDGDPSTYWHSTWQGGNVPAGTHYFIIEDADNTLLDGGLALMVSRRPSADNDHPTRFMVYGANSADAEDWTELGEISIPYGAKTDVNVASTAIAFEGKYRFFRFNCTDAAGSSYGCRGYFHMSELQVYPASTSTVYPTTQYMAMGAIATNLEAAIEALPESGADLTVEQYNNMKSAFEAFTAIYVNPDTLRTAVATAKAKAAGIVVGTDPGYWNGDDASALKNYIATAQTYDESGAYTPAKSREYVDNLAALTEEAYAKANQIKEGKWYAITFPSEALYETVGWDKAGAAANENDTNVFPELFGKTLAVGMAISDGTAPTYHGTDAITEAEDVSLGDRLYFIEDTPAEIGDAALFRFINIGDSAYLIQNKLTGLYVKAAGTSGQASLSVQPSLFKQSANGFGTSLIKANRLDGADQSYLHAQRDGNVLVTWNANGLGSNSCMMIQEVEDVVEDAITNAFNITVYNGSVTTHCYPVDVQCVDGTASIYVASVEGTTVTLNPLAEGLCPAGKPFVLIYPVDTYVNEADDDSEDSYVACQFEITDRTIHTTAGISGSLVGNFYGATAPKGSLIANENTFVPVGLSAGTAIPANQAYIDAQLESTVGVTITLEISDVEVDEVSSVLANVSKSGVIYTLDGKAMGRGNLNTLTTMPRGIYVVNGVKVAVK